MASIFKRTNEDGSKVWRAVIRIQGNPTTCKAFERKQEAEDWAKETKRSIKLGQYNFEAQKRRHTYAELVNRLQTDEVFHTLSLL